MTTIERPKDQTYLSVREVARRLAVSERTVRREIERGNLPAKRIGRILRIDPCDLAVFDYQAPPRRRPQPATAVPVARAPISASERAAERRRQIMREVQTERGDPEATTI